MTQNQKRIKIAEARGWVPADEREIIRNDARCALIRGPWWRNELERIVATVEDLPDYFSSRDAIVPAIIAMVDQNTWDDFQCIVEDLVPWHNRAQGRRKSLLTAEASILAEALGQHLNLWEIGE